MQSLARHHLFSHLGAANRLAGPPLRLAEFAPNAGVMHAALQRCNNYDPARGEPGQRPHSQTGNTEGPQVPLGV